MHSRAYELMEACWGCGVLSLRRWDNINGRPAWGSAAQWLWVKGGSEISVANERWVRRSDSSNTHHWSEPLSMKCWKHRHVKGVYSRIGLVCHPEESKWCIDGELQPPPPCDDFQDLLKEGILEHDWAGAKLNHPIQPYVHIVDRPISLICHSCTNKSDSRWILHLRNAKDAGVAKDTRRESAGWRNQQRLSLYEFLQSSSLKNLSFQIVFNPLPYLSSLVDHSQLQAKQTSFCDKIFLNYIFF